MADLNVFVTARDAGGLTASAAAVITTTPVATGWTTFTPTEPSGEGGAFIGTGTRKIYVSQSTGNDVNPGTFLAPYKTLAKGVAGLRSGKPDWLLLKKGDTWTNEAFGGPNRSGVSATAPMLIGSYGTGARPLVKTNSGVNGITVSGCDYFALVGIDLYSYKRDPANPSYAGVPTSDPHAIEAYTPVHWLLIEDCKLAFYGGTNINLQIRSLAQYVGIRRNVVVDAYSASGAHSQGAYLEVSGGLLIEENLFDHNGWNATVANGGPTFFNHNIYQQYNYGSAIVRGNISANASSHGMQIRSGGAITDNLCIRDPIAILLGAVQTTQNAPNTISANVILESNDIGPANPRGFGIDVNPIPGVVQITSNVIAHHASSMPYGHGVLLGPGTHNDVVQNNIIYQYDSPIEDEGTNNITAPNAINGIGYPAPNRSVGSYYGSIGGTPATLAGFLAAARSQSKDNWNPTLMAIAVSTYIRAGFRL